MNCLAPIFLSLLAAAPADAPQTSDDRLVIERFAAEPQLVTPTGIAVDDRGRVLVIESHTHFRPDDYAGPPADRIRVFEDTDGDGRADRISTFFEGTRFTMNLAVAHDGSVYVATRNELFRLRDSEGDGVADERTPIARLDTPGNYPHNGLSGFAFDFAGNVYFGLGENLGAEYRLIGSDGATLSGGGEGGNIYRCRADGSGLQRVATGFWNPFHLTFDAFGRLFAVDNDPDSRPPCRLLHVAPGGDYGYRFRNGRKGLHPFTAWNGELPGTLPMVAGTGEAPSGVVAYESDGLPDDYRGQLLVTSWGDHRLDRFTLERRGASFTSRAVPFVTGGEEFRPVGVAVAPDGSLFVSDWVDKSYTLHGKGRIWHIRAKQPPRTKRPTQPRQAIESADRALRERAARALAGDAPGRAALRERLAADRNARVRATALAALAAAGDRQHVAQDAFASAELPATDEWNDLRALAVSLLPEQFDLAELSTGGDPLVRAAALKLAADETSRPALLAALREADPFLRQAARAGLRRICDDRQLLSLAASDDPAVRLAGVLILRESNDAPARAALPRFLQDPDARVRFAAVQWVAEAALAEYRPRVEALLAESGTRDLFEACLATLERLDRQAHPDAAQTNPNQEIAGEEYVVRLLTADATPPAIRTRALRMLRPSHPALTLDRLKHWLSSPDEAMRLEAIRTLRESPASGAGSLLAELAANAAWPERLRAEAVVGLSGQRPSEIALLLALATGGDRALRDEALRSLRKTELTGEQRARLQAVAEGDSAAAELVARVLGGEPKQALPAASDVAAWLRLLDEPGDAAAGERVFFHPKAAGCYRCHQVDGRGGRIGPDLTTTARVLDRRRLVESIVQPSKEIAPQFVTYTLATADGRVLTGLLLGESANGDQTYADAEGRLFTLGPTQIDQRQPHGKSLMPDDLARTLTPQEFRDLLSFLSAP
ncbi:MAG TPA: PVC-type heme-binding CxxCH protein [Pirellulales bacterium]